MKWNENLPDTLAWQPETKAKETLKQALLLTCRAVQQRIVQEANIERMFNVNNFDSGPGLEDIVRGELRKLLPTRYDVSCGVLDDATGATVDDCDVLIVNRVWAPVVKLGATEESRRAHFPSEAVYGVIEVKQTLGYGELDHAMKKLVAAARLKRPYNPYGHITENQHITSFDKEGCILNPLFTAVLGTSLANDLSFRDVASRFFLVNRQLDRDEMVKMLVVLDQGVAWYTFHAEPNKIVSANYCWDRSQNLAESLLGDAPGDAFYKLFTELFGHLTRSVLAIHDLASKYGPQNQQVEHVSVDPRNDYVPPTRGQAG